MEQYGNGLWIWWNPIWRVYWHSYLLIFWKIESNYTCFLFVRFLYSSTPASFWWHLGFNCITRTFRNFPKHSSLFSCKHTIYNWDWKTEKVCLDVLYHWEIREEFATDLFIRFWTSLLPVLYWWRDVFVLHQS